MAGKRKRLRATATKPRATKPKARKPKPTAPRSPQKKPPRGFGSRGGSSTTPSQPKKESTKKRSHKTTRHVKRKRTGKIPAPTSKRPKLSRHPEAIRSRERRKVERARSDAREAERLEKLAVRRKKRKRLQPTERELAIEWCREIREKAIDATGSRISLSITEAEGGSRTPWLVVGRYDFTEDPPSYERFGAMFYELAADILLEARIHPDRLSQIRIVYADPNSQRGEGDSIVSQIGAWQFVVSEIEGEILGAGPDDEGALAVRYQETHVTIFYIYFSSELVQHKTVGPWIVTPGGKKP